VREAEEERRRATAEKRWRRRRRVRRPRSVASVAAPAEVGTEEWMPRRRKGSDRRRQRIWGNKWGWSVAELGQNFREVEQKCRTYQLLLRAISHCQRQSSARRWCPRGREEPASALRPGDLDPALRRRPRPCPASGPFGEGTGPAWADLELNASTRPARCRMPPPPSTMCLCVTSTAPRCACAPPP
jgi:hypothetical protein